MNINAQSAIKLKIKKNRERLAFLRNTTPPWVMVTKIHANLMNRENKKGLMWIRYCLISVTRSSKLLILKRESSTLTYDCIFIRKKQWNQVGCHLIEMDLGGFELMMNEIHRTQNKWTLLFQKSKHFCLLFFQYHIPYS